MTCGFAAALTRRTRPLLLFSILAAGAFAVQAQAPSPFDLSIEELGQLRVTTVSRRTEPLNRTAASVYVITAEDIRRSGVRSIPEALRLAPGVEVARNSSNEYTISIRGFSSDLSNKLLVLIDGRSVYSPLYAGVFWDVQDTLLADIERIEVVSGPGGTIWGANAVNGVINIITQSASDTLGAYAEVGGGGEERDFGAVRYGFKLGAHSYARAYAKHFERDDSEAASGEPAHDNWDMTRGGFAYEWDTGGDDVNVRADVYTGSESVLTRGDFTLGTLPQLDLPGTVLVAGRSVTANWRHRLAADADWRVQLWYDNTHRQIPGSFDEGRDTFNLAFLHDLRDAGPHDLIWGAELRSTSDELGNSLFSTFIPASRSDQTLSAFIQDRITLKPDRLYLTVGAKLEHNDYTGFEDEPNVRVNWQPSRRQTVWGAISRAVRVPARLNTDLRLYAPVDVPGLGVPLYINVNGNPDFDSEDLVAYEAGYRLQATQDLTLDVAVFDNFYHDLQTTQGFPPEVVPGPPAYILIPAMQTNDMKGETYGGTVAVNWQAAEHWRLQLQYAHLQMDLELENGSTDSGALGVAGHSPKNQAAVRSYLELPHSVTLYTSVRYVAELPTIAVPSYVAVDWSVGWRPNAKTNLSLTIENANDARHLEFGDGHYIERSAFLKAWWSF